MKFTKEHTMTDERDCDYYPVVHHCFLNAQRWATVPYEKLATTKDGDITQFRLHHFLLIRYNILLVFQRYA